VIFHGDSLETLKTMKANSIDSVVTDPPYGLSFMSKAWDYEVPTVELWREVLRVLKPGGHLLSFGGTRTYHRLVVNIEDAGFEIRDQIQWIYGSGFPKSLDVSKAIDKAAGAEREVVGVNPSSRPNSKIAGMRGFDNREGAPEDSAGIQTITAPATEAAKKWQGFGTSLKPANEPICVARKPLAPKHTVAQNVQAFGTGALNIDQSRIGFASESDRKAAAVHNAGSSASGSLNWNTGEQKDSSKDYRLQEGRWPANILFDEEAAAMLDLQSGQSAESRKGVSVRENPSESWKQSSKVRVETRHGDSGGASRFFYCAKASKAERNKGLEGMPKQVLATSTGQTRPGSPARLGADPHAVQEPVANHHPTVKPVKLMEYLVRLVTPPGGVCLDPFMGSGTTGVACKNLGFEFVGIERDENYVEIARKRVMICDRHDAAILNEKESEAV